MNSSLVLWSVFAVILALVIYFLGRVTMWGVSAETTADAQTAMFRADRLLAEVDAVASARSSDRATYDSAKAFYLRAEKAALKGQLRNCLKLARQAISEIASVHAALQAKMILPVEPAGRAIGGPITLPWRVGN